MLFHTGKKEALSEESIRAYLTAKTFGSKLILLEETDSTNNDAKRMAAEGAIEGTTVLANRQTAGKGRLGRSFFSPEEKGIYMSIVLRPQVALESSTLITSMAAVAVARAIDKTSGVYAQIKWVNDVFLNGKKVCGILTEGTVDSESGQLVYAVLGIGVNVGCMEFPEELRAVATSVGNEAGRQIQREILIAEILNQLEELYGTLASGGFLEESRKRSLVIGKEIKVVGTEQSYPARAVAIDELGQLVVETEKGRQTLHSGEVSVRL